MFIIFKNIYFLSLTINNNSSHEYLILQDRRVMFTPVSELAEITDFEHRLPINQWWLKIRPILRILAKHQVMLIMQ